MSKFYLFLTKPSSDQFINAFTQKLKCKAFRSKPITNVVKHTYHALSILRKNAIGENTSVSIINDATNALSKLDDQLNKKPYPQSLFDYTWPDWNGKIPKNTHVAIAGLVRGTKEIFDGCVANKKDWYYFDQPYFFASGYKESITGDEWYRVCKNNTQKTYIETSALVDLRYKKLIKRLNKKSIEHLTPKPWRYTGSHILVIPPSYHTARWYGIDRHQWTKTIVEQIKRYDQEHPIVVREKYKNGADWGERLDKPLKDDLVNCYAMVSFHSMSAVEAVMAGIPSFSSEHSPAYPVSLSLYELHKLKTPLYAKNRDAWIKSLLCSQFTLDEMRSGFAYAHLNEQCDDFDNGLSFWLHYQWIAVLRCWQKYCDSVFSLKNQKGLMSKKHQRKIK